MSYTIFDRAAIAAADSKRAAIAAADAKRAELDGGRARMDTSGEWVQRIDRDKLAEVLDSCFPGCDGADGEDFIERYATTAVDAVLAALSGGTTYTGPAITPTEEK